MRSEWQWFAENGQERRLVHRRGKEPIEHFPWVRCPTGYVGSDSRVLAYIDRRATKGDRYLGKRLALLNTDDYDSDSVYLMEGDCPVEAVLPASFLPNEKPIPAYPVHLVLSTLWAVGFRLRVSARGELFAEGKPWPSAFVRGVLHSMRDDVFEACKLWVASYWGAPESVRYRWVAQGAKTEEETQGLRRRLAESASFPAI